MSQKTYVSGGISEQLGGLEGIITELESNLESMNLTLADIQSEWQGEAKEDYTIKAEGMFTTLNALLNLLRAMNSDRLNYEEAITSSDV